MLRLVHGIRFRARLRVSASALLVAFVLAGPAEALVGGACEHHGAQQTEFAGDARLAGSATSADRTGAPAHVHEGRPERTRAESSADSRHVHGSPAASPESDGAARGHAHGAPVHDEDGACTCLGSCVQASAQAAPAVAAAVEMALAPSPAPEAPALLRPLIERADFLLPYATAPPLHG